MDKNKNIYEAEGEKALGILKDVGHKALVYTLGVGAVVGGAIVDASKDIVGYGLAKAGEAMSNAGNNMQSSEKHDNDVDDFDEEDYPEDEDFDDTDYMFDEADDAYQEDPEDFDTDDFDYEEDDEEDNESEEPKSKEDDEY